MITDSSASLIEHDPSGLRITDPDPDDPNGTHPRHFMLQKQTVWASLARVQTSVSAVVTF